MHDDMDFVSPSPKAIATYESTYELLDAGAVAEIRYLRAMKCNFVNYLAERYDSGEAVVVAGLCDEILDRSGRLLGEVRKVAIDNRQKK